jgi:hypothetical protein
VSREVISRIKDNDFEVKNGDDFQEKIYYRWKPFRICKYYEGFWIPDSRYNIPAT